MVAIIESGSPGEGNRYAAGTNKVAAALIAVPTLLLAKGLLSAGQSTREFQDALEANVWLFGLLAGLIALHMAAAYGSQRRKSWARKLSRTLAALLILMVPIGTVIGVLLFRYTSPDRWITE
jgi:hypothetical protein